MRNHFWVVYSGDPQDLLFYLKIQTVIYLLKTKQQSKRVLFIMQFNIMLINIMLICIIITCYF